MPKTNQYHPQTVTHPGATLAEKLKELNMESKELSVKTGKPEKTISAIVNEKSAITSDMAIQLESVLQIPARFWLQRQAQYDEYLARERSMQYVMNAMEWSNLFPVGRMQELGWIPKFKTPQETVSGLFTFFGISNHTAWERYYLKSDLKVQFRISLSHTKDPSALSAWLRRGELLAMEVDAPKYNKDTLKKTLPLIKEVMYNHPKDFFIRLQKLSLGAGVIVVPTPCLPKAPICGATRWIGENPIIQLSGRYKRNDSFWFTFFHEIGHIMLHGKKEVFLENVDYNDKDLIKEKEANEFAANWLLSPEEEAEILERAQIGIEDVILFAQQFKTHPAIIIGRLQHKELVPWGVGQQFIKPISLDNN